MLVGLDTPELSELEPGTVIGTSSNRRRANLLHLNDDVEVEECRGNVPTRMEKLFDEDSSYDSLVLAAAGLERIGVEEITARLFRLEEMLPAAGQGALAVVARRDDEEVRSILEELDHPPSRMTITAERTLLNRLEAGCQAPLGTLARIQSGNLLLKAQVTHPDGDRRIEDEIEGPSREAESLGRRLAERLLDRGASDFIP
jgi:hydroxymethylbilane synthase